MEKILSLFAIVAVGLLGCGLLAILRGMVNQSDIVLFHQWIDEISYFNGTGAVGLLLALLFFKVGQRKYIATATGITVIIATLAAIYMYYLHPDNALESFTIIAASLDGIALCGFLLGAIVEIYWSRQGSIVVLNQKTIDQMKGTLLEDVVMKEPRVENPLIY